MCETGGDRFQEDEARKFVRAVYAAMGGRPLEWRLILGISAKQAAVDHAVEQGWIIVKEGSSVCLTVKGAALAPR